MFIDHVLFERPLSTVESWEVAYAGGKLQASAVLQGSPKLQEVQLAYTSYSDAKYLRYLRSVDFADAPQYNHTKAKWTTVPMQPDGSKWSVAIDIPGPQPEFVAAFIDVKDEYRGKPGYVSSFVCEIQRK